MKKTQGALIGVSSILQTEKSTRKIITIEEDNITIEIKLWGEKVTLVPTVGETTMFKCMAVDFYKEKISLNSTVNTTIETMQDNESVQGKVDAASFEADHNSILIKDLFLIVDDRDMDRIFPSGEFTDNRVIKGERKGNKLVSLTTVTEE